MVAAPCSTGTWQRKNAKPLAEDCLFFEIAQIPKLIMQRVVKQRECLTLEWTSDDNQLITCKATVAAAAQSAVRLVNKTNDGQTHCVNLVSHKPNYGGERFYFLCPISQRRCTKLYWHPKSKRLSAIDPAFYSRTSQCLAKNRQHLYQAQKLIARHGINQAPFLQRPRYLHLKKFQRVTADYNSRLTTHWKTALGAKWIERLSSSS